jgi:hypothetical protein
MYLIIETLHLNFKNLFNNCEKIKPGKFPGLKSLAMKHCYLFKYITSFTNFTVRGTSGNAAATRLGA